MGEPTSICAAVAALRSELQLVLQEAVGNVAPASASLELALEWLTDQEPPRWRVVPAGPPHQGAGSGPGPLHKLTIQFAVVRRPGGQAFEVAGSSARPEGTGPSSSHPGGPGLTGLAAELVPIFGAPGFDNAARASVFIELMEGLSAESAAALWASLRDDATEVPLQRLEDPVASHARMRLARLLALGPTGFARGREALLLLLQENSVESISQVLRERWKTQSEWAELPATGPDSAEARE